MFNWSQTPLNEPNQTVALPVFGWAKLVIGAAEASVAGPV
jgi:hypothetical protein